MKMRLLPIILLLLAPVATVRAAADPELLFQEGWYIEEGLRDPLRAAQLYLDIAAKQPDNRDLAARALGRAAGCYKKLGEEELERETWARAWKNYKEEMGRSPDWRREQIDLMARIDKVLREGDTATLMYEILQRMEARHIYPVRDKMLDEARGFRRTDPIRAIEGFNAAIMLSMQMKDDETAARAQSEIGAIYLEMEDYINAIVAYNEALADYPNQREVLAWSKAKIAEAYRLRDMPTPAITEYEELLANFPEQKEAQFWAKLWLGDCHRELGRISRAREAWNSILESPDAGQFPRQAKLAKILLGLEEPPAELKVSKPDHFTNDEAYFIAVRHEMDGNIEQALAFYDKCMGVSDGKDWPYLPARRMCSMHGRISIPE